MSLIAGNYDILSTSCVFPELTPDVASLLKSGGLDPANLPTACQIDCSKSSILSSPSTDSFILSIKNYSSTLANCTCPATPPVTYILSSPTDLGNGITSTLVATPSGYNQTTSLYIPFLFDSINCTTSADLVSSKYDLTGDWTTSSFTCSIPQTYTPAIIFEMAQVGLYPLPSPCMQACTSGAKIQSNSSGVLVTPVYLPLQDCSCGGAGAPEYFLNINQTAYVGVGGDLLTVQASNQITDSFSFIFANQTESVVCLIVFDAAVASTLGKRRRL